MNTDTSTALQPTAEKQPGKPNEAQPRKRGAGYPKDSLAELSAPLKEAGKYGFEHSTSAFASYLGLSTTNSGTFRQRVASLRDYKLVAGRGGTLTMTDTGRRVARPTSDADERQAFQEAFFNCTVFAELYGRSAKGVALQQSHLEAQAIHEFQISPANGGSFTKSFLDSLVVAMLGQVNEDGTVVLEPESDSDSSPKGDEDPLDAGARAGAMLVAGGEKESVSATTAGELGRESLLGSMSPEPTIRQVWEIHGGEISFLICMGSALPATSFEKIGNVMSSIEELVKVLGVDHQDADDEVEEQ